MRLLPSPFHHTIFYPMRSTRAESSAEEDDATLLARIQQGEHAAFERLVRRHATRFYRIAYRFVGQRAESEDIVQDAFLKLWEKPHHWDPKAGSQFTTWFHRVVINTSLDRTKKNKHSVSMPENMVLVDHSAWQDEQLIQHQHQQLLEQEIAALPTRQRIALNLCVYEGMSNQEAADLMKLHIKALQSLLIRAKTTLKHKLEHLL